MTGPLTLQGSGDFKIRFEKRAYAALSSYASTHEAGFLEATTMLRDHISVTPKKMMPPRLKELTGVWKQNYQLDFGGRHRLVYTVNEETKTVYVKLCGPHPDWSKRRRDR